MANNLKKYFLILLLLNLLFSYSPAFAQTTPVTPASPVYTGVSSQIEKYLCAPTPSTGSQTTNPNSGDLYKCVNQLYKFAIAFASVIGVLFLVIAGYVYMSAEGNQESVEKAKSILVSTISSLVILFVGYILLYSINPDLVQFHSVQPPAVTGIPTGTTGATGGAGTTGGGTGGGGGACQVVSSGVASVAALQSTCFGNNASQASMISQKETGGNATLASGVDICLDQNGNKIPYTGQYAYLSKYLSVSWGLFQINISANTITTPSGQTLNCPSAFSSAYTGSHKQCTVTNMSLYEQCIGAAIDSATNIQTACRLSNNGQNWGSWAHECGF